MVGTLAVFVCKARFLLYHIAIRNATVYSFPYSLWQVKGTMALKDLVVEFLVVLIVNVTAVLPIM